MTKLYDPYRAPNPPQEGFCGPLLKIRRIIGSTTMELLSVFLRFVKK